MSKSSGKTAFLIGWFGRKNVGDDLLFLNALEQLKKSGVSQITVYAEYVDALPRYDEILVVKQFKGLFRGHILLKQLITICRNDILVFGGGSMFSDNDMTRALGLKYKSAFTFIAKCLRKKIFAMGCGVGPIKSAKGKKLTRKIFRRFTFVQVRDEESRQLLIRNGIEAQRISKSFDPAISIASKAFPIKGQDTGNRERLGLGISFSSSPGTEQYSNNDVLKVLAESINKISYINSSVSITVYLIQMCGNGRFNDLALREKFSAYLNEGITIQCIRYTNDTKAFLAQIYELDALVSERLHTSILAFAMRIPFLVIPYHTKCLDFISSVNYEGSTNQLSIDSFLLTVLHNNGSKLFGASVELDTIRYAIKESDRSLRHAILC